MVNEIVHTVQTLPATLGDIATKMRGFVQSMFRVVGNTAIEEIKSITKEIRDFLNGIQHDALNFYNVSWYILFIKNGCKTMFFHQIPSYYYCVVKSVLAEVHSL